jgi:hypothetical protein
MKKADGASAATQYHEGSEPAIRLITREKTSSITLAASPAVEKRTIACLKMLAVLSFKPALRPLRHKARKGDGHSGNRGDRDDAENLIGKAEIPHPLSSDEVCQGYFEKEPDEPAHNVGSGKHRRPAYKAAPVPRNALFPPHRLTPFQSEFP